MIIRCNTKLTNVYNHFQFVRWNGLVFRYVETEFHGREEERGELAIGFAFSDCGDAVAVVRQSLWYVCVYVYIYDVLHIEADCKDRGA